MNRASYPLRNRLLVGLRRCFDPLAILDGKANLDYSPHRFALREFWTTHFSFLLLCQGCVSPVR